VFFTRLAVLSLLAVPAANAADLWGNGFFSTLKGIVDPVPMILQGRAPIKAAFTVFATGAEVRAPVETIRGLSLLRDVHGFPIHGIWIETQHIRFSPSEIQALVAHGRDAGFHTLVRVPSERRADIQGYIDTGVEGIVIPVTETAEQVEQAFQHTFYASQREAGFSPDLGNLQTTSAEQLKKVDQRKLLAFMIESVAGVDGIQKMVSKATSLFDGAGIPRKHGIFWMGPYDLKRDLSRREPKKDGEAYVAEAMEKVAAAVKSAGFSMGGHMPTLSAGVERVSKLSFNIFTIAGAADSAYNPTVPTTGGLFKNATEAERTALLQPPKLLDMEDQAREIAANCRMALARQADAD
jgi:2-keto-3-deoxy-L-rhamnonate aldolase RhmA